MREEKRFEGNCENFKFVKVELSKHRSTNCWSLTGFTITPPEIFSTDTYVCPYLSGGKI